MIRDNNKIYGEANDPNTVIATGTLTSSQFIVGAGNKGITSFNPGAKRILTTGAGGVASSFPFGTPNKVIGTDESGNLVLKDPVREWHLASFGGTQNPITSIEFTDYLVGTYSYELKEESEGVSMPRIIQALLGGSRANINLLFRDPIVIPMAATCFISVNMSFSAWNMLDISWLERVNNQDNYYLIRDAAIPAGISFNNWYEFPRPSSLTSYSLRGLRLTTNINAGSAIMLGTPLSISAFVAYSND